MTVGWLGLTDDIDDHSDMAWLLNDRVVLQVNAIHDEPGKLHMWLGIRDGWDKEAIDCFVIKSHFFPISPHWKCHTHNRVIQDSTVGERLYQNRD